MQNNQIMLAEDYRALCRAVEEETPNQKELPPLRDVAHQKYAGTLMDFLRAMYVLSRWDNRHRADHPSFPKYASGVLASEYTRDVIDRLWTAEKPALERRYPPRPLFGLGPGACWSPPKRH